MKLNFPSIWKNSFTGPALNFSSCSNSGSMACNVSGNVVTAVNVVATTSMSPFSFTLNYIVNPGTE
jgi:hypothetical protein